MNLILLKMFIAILDGHYIDSESDLVKGTVNLGIFSWLTLHLKIESKKLNEFLRNVFFILIIRNFLNN